MLCLALTQYSEEDKDLWLKPDVDATCEFMEFSSKFFNAMNLQESEEGLDEEKACVLKKISVYMRDVAIPSGVLVKSTGKSCSLLKSSPPGGNCLKSVPVLPCMIIDLILR